MKKKKCVPYISSDTDRKLLLKYANNAARNDEFKFEILRFLMDSTVQGHMNWGEDYHMQVYHLLIKIGQIPGGIPNHKRIKTKEIQNEE